MSEPASPFAAEFVSFSQQDATAPRGAVVFYGSSSIRLWDTLARDFEGVPVVNRGFGGSTLAECTKELPKLITPLQPAAMVVYAGDNDLDQGASPERALEIFKEFMRTLRAQFASIPVAFISVKPSPARFWNLGNIRRANDLFKAAAAEWEGLTYLDLFPHMLSPAGGSRPDLFTGDGLHMNENGYRLWTENIRAWLDAHYPIMV